MVGGGGAAGAGLNAFHLSEQLSGGAPGAGVNAFHLSEQLSDSHFGWSGFDI